MDRTKHDLSFNQVKLDYQALLRTSIIAFAHTRNEIARLTHDTYSLKPALSLHHTARLIAEEADKMVVAAETMDTLEEGLTREELEVINKPEVRKED